MPETDPWLLAVIAFCNEVFLLLLIIEICVLPFSAFFFFKREISLQNYDKRSGKGSASVVPEELKKWNWGAAGLEAIWGMYHNIWISLVGIIPIVGLFWWIIMGIKGNEWAWKNNQWESVEVFQRTQQKWRPIGIVCVILFQIVPLINGLIRLKHAYYQ